MVKNPPVVWEIWVQSLDGGGHGNLLQYSFLERPLDRGAWWAIVYVVSKSQT